MFYRFGLFLFMGLFILAACLPRSFSPSVDQVATDSALLTETPQSQGPIPVQIIVSVTGTPPTQTPTPTQTSTPTQPPTTPPTLPATTTLSPSATPTITGTILPSIFENFPPEYKRIQLPQPIIDIVNRGGFVVPLPTNPGSLAEELRLAAPAGLDLGRFDFGRIVHFPPNLGNEYIAVPVSATYFKSHFGINEDFNRGVLVGLIYDKNGAYRGVRDIYEIWAFENHVYLYGRWFKNAVQLTLANNQYYWRAQDYSADLPLEVFIKNGCWLCWDQDSRCGCLVCID